MGPASSSTSPQSPRWVHSTLTPQRAGCSTSGSGGQGERFCFSRISESAPYQSLPPLPVSLVETVSHDCLQGMGTICFPISLMGTVSYDSLQKGWKYKAFQEQDIVDPHQISIVIVRKKGEVTISGQPAASAPTFTISLPYLLTAWICISTFVVREAELLARGLMGVVWGTRLEPGSLSWTSSSSADLHSCPILSTLLFHSPNSLSLHLSRPAGVSTFLQPGEERAVVYHVYDPELL